MKSGRRNFVRRLLELGASAGVAGVLFGGARIPSLVSAKRPGITIPISTECAVPGNSSSPQFGALFSGDGGTSVEADSQIRMGSAGTFSRLRIRVFLNQLPQPTIITFRQNGNDTPLSVTVPGATTGTFTDDTHVVDVEKDDLVNYAFNFTPSMFHELVVNVLQVDLTLSEH